MIVSPRPEDHDEGKRGMRVALAKAARAVLLLQARDAPPEEVAACVIAAFLMDLPERGSALMIGLGDGSGGLIRPESAAMFLLSAAAER